MHLDLPPVRGDTPAFVVTIPLTRVVDAGLSPARIGPWADVHHGVRVGAPHVAFDGDRIIVDVSAEAAGARVAGLEDWDGSSPPALTDDLGNVYPLLREHSALTPGGSRPGSAVFAGPVAPGATKLTLTLPVVRLRQPLRDTLVLPQARLVPGQPLAVNRTLPACPSVC